MPTDLEERALTLERTLTTIPGVRGAKVHLGPERANVESLRVLVVPERASEDLMRDIQLAARQVDLSIPPDLIQILRTGEARKYETNQRRRLASVSTTRSEDRFAARVALELGGDVLVGESDIASAGLQFEHRSVARATLEGLRALLDTHIELEAVYILNVGTERFAVVIVAGTTGNLVGSAVVRVDEYDAIARATLDALNRQLTRPQKATRT